MKGKIKMELNELINAIESLNRKGGCFYGFETITEPKLTKKNRTTKEPTNFVVTIHATFSAMLGINYENAVNNHRERNGLERDFVAQKPFGKHYVEGSKYLMQSDKDENKYYLALDKVGGVKKIYLINGREATPEEIEDLKANYLPKVSPHPYGINWRTYGIEGIVKVK
jgi:hypothetical protein